MDRPIHHLELSRPTAYATLRYSSIARNFSFPDSLLVWFRIALLSLYVFVLFLILRLPRPSLDYCFLLSHRTFSIPLLLRLRVRCRALVTTGLLHFHFDVCHSSPCGSVPGESILTFFSRLSFFCSLDSWRTCSFMLDPASYKYHRPASLNSRQFGPISSLLVSCVISRPPPKLTDDQSSQRAVDRPSVSRTHTFLFIVNVLILFLVERFVSLPHCRKDDHRSLLVIDRPNILSSRGFALRDRGLNSYFTFIFYFRTLA